LGLLEDEEMKEQGSVEEERVTDVFVVTTKNHGM